MDQTETPHLRDSVNLTGEESTRQDGHSDMLQQGSRPSVQNISKKANELPCNPASPLEKHGETEEHVKRHGDAISHIQTPGNST